MENQLEKIETKLQRIENKLITWENSFFEVSEEIIAIVEAYEREQEKK